MQRTVLDLNTNSKRKVLIIGESYMNLEMETDSLLKNGNITYGGKYGFHPYGMTAAAAITVGKMGSRCVLCSKLANDSNGSRLRGYYEANGLDTAMITSPENAQTGFSVTLYDNKGEIEHYVSKGANAFFTKKDTQCCEKSESLALYACNEAMKRRVDMIVDYNSSSSSLPLSEFSGIRAFIISDETLSKMTGFYLTSEDRIVRALISLKSKIPSKYYIIQVGNDTSLIYDGNSYQKITLPVPEGATEGKMNPTYTGAFIAEYLETKNMLRACTYAGVASLLTKANEGVLEKIPSRQEIDEYIAEKGIKTFVW